MQLKQDEGRLLGQHIVREANQFYEAGDFENMTESHWRVIEGSRHVNSHHRADASARMFVELKEYKVEHGHCNVSQSGGKLVT